MKLIVKYTHAAHVTDTKW